MFLGKRYIGHACLVGYWDAVLETGHAGDLLELRLDLVWADLCMWGLNTKDKARFAL